MFGKKNTQLTFREVVETNEEHLPRLSESYDLDSWPKAFLLKRIRKSVPRSLSKAPLDVSALNGWGHWTWSQHLDYFAQPWKPVFLGKRPNKACPASKEDSPGISKNVTGETESVLGMCHTCLGTNSDAPSCKVETLHIVALLMSRGEFSAHKEVPLVSQMQAYDIQPLWLLSFCNL